MIHVKSLLDVPTSTKVAVSNNGGWDCYGAGDDMPAMPQPSPEDLARQMSVPYSDAVQSLLDTEAQRRGYDGVLSMVSYSGDSHPKFGTEGSAAKSWRTACWAQCYAILAAVESGARPMPTVAELLAEMPVFVLP
jgi:hypothetical protein